MSFGRAYHRMLAFPTRPLMTAIFIFALQGCANISRPALPLSSLDFLCRPSMAVPDVLPLGSVSRAHWHTMETNGEASDFVMYRNEFVDGSPELSPFGSDHIMEIAARMPTSPFPVLIERSDENRNPELDATRRNTVVQLLLHLGVHDANQRTVVSQPYSDGISSDRTVERRKSGLASAR